MEMIKKPGGRLPKLRAKGAERRYLIPFALDLAEEFAPVGIHWASIKELFSNLHVLQLYVSNKANYTASDAEEACRKFCAMYTALGQEAMAQERVNWQPKPKMHLLQELVEYQAVEHGCPVVLVLPRRVLVWVLGSLLQASRRAE